MIDHLPPKDRARLRKIARRRHFEVQGFSPSRNDWHTLFAPYWTVEPALNMMARLCDLNEACRYRVIEVQS